MSGAILVYDHECPVCRNYCQAVELRKAAGDLQLINAREDHPIVDEIKAMGLDLDEGFVLKLDGEIFYGPDAIHMLALLSTNTGFFNRLNYLIFKSKTLSKILYPPLKLGRNILLRLLGKDKISNS